MKENGKSWTKSVSHTLTDRKILQTIHDEYLSQFGNFDKNLLEPIRSSKIYVPIDCKAIATKLRVDPDIIFGRLYYPTKNMAIPKTTVQRLSYLR